MRGKDVGLSDSLTGCWLTLVVDGPGGREDKDFQALLAPCMYEQNDSMDPGQLGAKAQSRG